MARVFARSGAAKTRAHTGAKSRPFIHFQDAAGSPGRFLKKGLDNSRAGRGGNCFFS
jgi:hypothetical protein